MLEEDNQLNNSTEDTETVTPLPQIVSEFDKDRRDLALSYTRALRHFGFKMTIVSLFVSLTILLSKVTVEFEQVIRTSVSDNPFTVVGVFFLISFIIITIVELPISYYTFSRYSRKYGLVKLSNRHWLKRQLKGDFFSILVGIILFEGFYWILRAFPETWWIIGTIALLLFSLIMGALVPIFILPRFYKFSSLDETHPELAAEVLQMVETLGVKTTKVLNWHLGEITTVGNAGLIGFGSTRRIVIADTMLEKYTPEEIKWVLLHEIGHFKHHDMWRQILISICTTIFMFFLTHILFTPIADFLGYPGDITSIGSLPVLGIIFFMISSVLFNVPSLAYSRKREAAADSYASSHINKPVIATSLFIKMADQNLADIDPPWWEKYLFMSHPPIKERMADRKDSQV
ncbi:MAG: M48 family metallopeptidase [Candidatus Heimdallarchaeota archaeon]|nr:M48 family metallopeptidase [Candidatus Heimdallarchaeota archaeon]